MLCALVGLRLCSLDLADNNLGSACAVALARTLARSPGQRLEFLGLSGNGVDPAAQLEIGGMTGLSGVDVFT